ncbi:MAG TPA: DUF1501 domain-containing protein [Pirellulales bacterium]|nr:DUF1501 domain-containing protein [Pirellulales bacterium]
MSDRNYACQSPEHRISRRSLLAGLLGGSLGTGLVDAGLGHIAGLSHLIRPAVAGELAARQKRVLVFFMAGGLSQLESWDPKPGTDTGGPFRAIPTSVPGVHISELLPYTAQQMHRLSLVRSVNTKEDDHGKGAIFIETGRRDMPGQRFPTLGSAVSRLLAPAGAALPGYVHIQPGGAGVNKADAAFLGPKFASISIDNGKPPADLLRPDGLSPAADLTRNELRRKANQRFTARRRTADTEAYGYSYDQALQLMERADVFDVTKEPAAEQERYGSHDFGRHCLLARRLLEQGMTCVKVSHSNYDTHFENFDFHIEQLGEFDRPFATLIDDLAQRGMLETTLVLVISEFGRTPNINPGLGRDHWGSAWSVAMAGCGIQKGAVIGKTNDNGTAVAEREVDGRHLFHTYLAALGLDPKENYPNLNRPIPIGDPAGEKINELLA